MKLGYFAPDGTINYFEVPVKEKLMIVSAPGCAFIVRRNSELKNIWSVYEYASGLLISNGHQTRKAAAASITDETVRKTLYALERGNLPRHNEVKP